MSISYTPKNVKAIESTLKNIAYKIKNLREDFKGDNIALALLQTSERICNQLLDSIKNELPEQPFIEEYKYLRSTAYRARDEVIRLGSEEQRAKIDDIVSLINELGHTKLISKIEENEDAVREYRVSELSKIINNLETRINSTQDILQSIQSDSESKLEAIEAFLTETKSRLTKKEEEVNQIIGRTTEKAIAGNYETTARNESETADRMRSSSLAFMTLMILVTSFTYYQSLSSDTDIVSSLFKMSIVLILSIPAGYLARESTKHRHQQHKYEQMALHLKAASPYVENLPEDIKNEIKIRLAEQIFSQNPKNDQGDESFKLGVDLIVKKVLERLEKSK